MNDAPGSSWERDHRAKLPLILAGLDLSEERQNRGEVRHEHPEASGLEDAGMQVPEFEARGRQLLERSLGTGVVVVLRPEAGATQILRGAEDGERQQGNSLRAL